MPDALPLEGITVVALEQAVAVPFATRQLADLGARVIKIERVGVGDFARQYESSVRGMSAHFVWLNRSKESLALDMKHAEAQTIVHQLLETADVFIQNLAPGAAARLGFGAALLHARYPRLIICDLSGYGSSGPYRDKKAYDLLVQCETGVVAVTGTPEAPSKAGIAVADLAGGMYAYSGILTALIQRGRTGEGTMLEVSLFDGLAEWMGYPAYFTKYGGDPPARTGASHATIAPYGPFAAGDGGTVFLGVQNEREWATFCAAVLERPDIATDPRFASGPARVAHRAELHAAIAAVFDALTATEVADRLEAAGIANARLNSVPEFLDHPQLAARDRWQEVASPVGPLAMLKPPVIIAGVAPRMEPIPAVGAHTEAILRSLGYDDERIDRLHAEHII
ncbi:MAG: CoA transferase [Thermomicrobia bacterium]|nr:CoA transferase [Thermomicrobia bacterium]